MPMDLTVKGSESHNFPLGKFLARKKKYQKLRKEMRYTELQEEKLPANMQYDQESNLTNAQNKGPVVWLMVRQLSEKVLWGAVPWDYLGRSFAWISWIVWLLCCINTTEHEGFSEKQRLPSPCPDCSKSKHKQNQESR